MPCRYVVSGVYIFASVQQSFAVGILNPSGRVQTFLYGSVVAYHQRMRVRTTYCSIQYAYFTSMRGLNGKVDAGLRGKWDALLVAKMQV